MSQLKLIANDESAEDLCELIKALHTEMLEMRAEMQRGFDVLLAVKTDDTETLRKMIVSAPPAVVPFEDETAPVVEPLPVLASCPCCSKKAIMEVQIEQLFGYRTMADGKTIVQSWCRECRALEGKTSPRRKRAKAVAWSKMDAQACAFAKAYTQTRNEMLEYEAKAKNEAHSPAVRAQYQAKADAKRKEQAKHKSEYNKRVAVLQAGLTK